MTARDDLINSTVIDRAEANRLADALITERDAEIVAWLGKKAKEFRSAGGKQRQAQADAVDAMASKLARGAVRPDNVAGVVTRNEVLHEAASIAATFLGRFPDWDAMKAAGIIGPHTMARAIGDELRRMADAGQVGTVTAPSGETTQPANFFQPDHTYTRQHHGHLIEFLVEHVATAPGGSYPIAFGWRREPCISTWAPEDSDDLDGWTDITDVGETTQPAPRTERSYWQAIADALNASAAAGMHVGIDIDGTLTDHTAWSVIWDRQTEQWAVAGYDNYDDHGSIEDAHSADELYEMDRDAEFRLDAEDDARNTAAVEAEERGDAL